ncbi:MULTISPECIES: FG-GAP repeat protein [Capnocytophaga]|jgi:hypothetical protein|uniref:FG-GAP repeat protein n=1 Tax=Capnocytophaga TaxID=1016 RepID=UPI00027C6A06|nr:MULTISPECIES: hypothetical protein [Capnocytophaga]EJU31399.1 hypothetical protein HMPREF1154_1913 [Capnocytophaga sp. CM59]
MKYFFWSVLGLLASIQGYGQAQSLQEEQIQKQFPAKVQKQLGITYPITKAYTYKDKEGTHVWVFTENKLYERAKRKEQTYKKNSEGEVINDKIKAFHLLEKADTYQVVRVVYDYSPKWEGTEFSIWFWTKFVSFTDLDQDGYVDPIIVYGAAPTDGDPDRGKVKLLAYHKGEKTAIRHQDDPSDQGRETQIDASYYTLPRPIRQKMFDTINHLQENQLTLFNPEDFKKLKR